MSDPNDPLSKLHIATGKPLTPAPHAASDGPALNVYDVPVEGTHVKDYLRVLYKWRWLVTSTFVVVMLCTAVYTFTATPIYRANVKILIDPGAPNYANSPEVVGQDMMTEEYFQTQYDLLKSRSLAQQTLESVHAWDTVLIGPKKGPSLNPLALAVSAGVWVKRLIVAPLPAQPNKGALDKNARQSLAIDTLLGMVSVVPVKNSRVVDLQVSSYDPQMAMQLVNALASAYMKQNLDFKFATSVEATTWLDSQLEESKQTMQKAEAAMQAYREQHGAIPADDTSNIVVQKLAQLSAAHTTAATKRMEQEALYKQLMAVQNDPTKLDAFPAVLNNVNIQAQRSELSTLQRSEADLTQTFGPGNPRVMTVRTQIAAANSKLQNEISNVVTAVKTEYEAAKAQEDSLSRALQDQNAVALKTSGSSIEFGVLRRDAESARTLYQTVLQRAKETGASTELHTTNVRVVDYAELPRSQASPNSQLDLLYGFFAGIVLAMGLGFFFEYLDNRIKTPEEIKIHLGVPSLGLLPVVRGIDEAHPYPLFNGPAWPKLNEALRTFRTNVVFSSAEQGPRSIMITSTGPSEGKTLVSSNLSITLAEAGLRVLLIDADMRRPKLHQVFKLDQEPGLSNLMVGTSKASESVRKTSVQGLWVLPAGRIPPNPAELLGSARFADFLTSLKEHFDWVLVDTPPVMAVADASVVAHTVGGVVFVIGAQMVNRHAAQEALAQLDNARAHIIGAVLNKVDLDRHSYYYAQYYRKEYADYYSAPTKDKTDIRPVA